MKKKSLTYENLTDLATAIARDVELATGLFVVYVKEKKVLVCMAPKKGTQIILETFDFFIEDGEVILEHWRLGVRPWLLNLVTKSYKKHRNKV